VEIKEAKLGRKFDISMTATRLILQHGEDAPIFAAMEADACAEAGDLDGKIAWLKVIEAIKVFQGAPKTIP
jgi:hypothetical protein